MAHGIHSGQHIGDAAMACGVAAFGENARHKLALVVVGVLLQADGALRCLCRRTAYTCRLSIAARKQRIPLIDDTCSQGSSIISAILCEHLLKQLLLQIKHILTVTAHQIQYHTYRRYTLRRQVCNTNPLQYLRSRPGLHTQLSETLQLTRLGLRLGLGLGLKLRLRLRLRLWLWLWLVAHPDSHCVAKYKPICEVDAKVLKVIVISLGDRLIVKGTRKHTREHVSAIQL